MVRGSLRTYVRGSLVPVMKVSLSVPVLAIAVLKNLLFEISKLYFEFQKNKIKLQIFKKDWRKFNLFSFFQFSRKDFKNLFCFYEKRISQKILILLSEKRFSRKILILLSEKRFSQKILILLSEKRFQKKDFIFFFRKKISKKESFAKICFRPHEKRITEKRFFCRPLPLIWSWRF